MKFKVRRYAQEEESASLTREPAYDNPLSTLSHKSHHHISIASPLQTEPVENHENDAIVDPLQVDANRDPLADFTPSTATTAYQRIYQNNSDKSVVDWESYRASILQRFASSDTIRVSKTFRVVSRHLKGRTKPLTEAHIQELDEPGKVSDEDSEIISQEEYVTHLRELNRDIAQAWLNNERVAALRQAVKVAKLLSDTSVPKFYPSLFVLVTDVLETIGKLVWERIKGKAELDDSGELIKSLPDNFTTDDVRQDAKDTCNNWFYKIGSIPELLPRIYLEIAILNCMRFLQKDPPKSALQRLTMMIRGLADPLAAAYAYVYLAHKGQNIIPHETAYLIMGLHDYLILYQRVLSGAFDGIIVRTGLKKQAYASLMDPMFELLIQCICAHASQEELLFILKTFCEHEAECNAGATRPISVVVYYLLKQIPAILVANKLIDLSNIVKSAQDVSKPQYLNYILLGSKLTECNPSRELRLTVLNDIWKVVLTYPDLFEYLMVADVFIDYILQCCTENEVNVMLSDIMKHLTKAQITEDALKVLESIVLKIMTKIPDLKHSLTLPYFLDILDKFHGDTRNSLHKKILQKVSKNGQLIFDPLARHFLFELSKSLYRSLDTLCSDDDQRQITRLISRFVQLVDFGNDHEEHFSFLLNCRGTFSNMDFLRDTLLHQSCGVVVKVLKAAKGVFNQNVTNFVKGCITFNEITIPRMRDIIKRIYLYIETAEVALMSGLVSHSESLLKSSITILNEIEAGEGLESEKLGCIKKMCSFIILIPGYTGGVGAFCLLTDLVQLITSHSVFRETYQVQALVGTLLACNALSQEILPYHVNSKEIISNDELFAGDSAYHEELVMITRGILRGIAPNVRKASNPVIKALVSQVLAITLQVDCHEEMDDFYN